MKRSLFVLLSAALLAVSSVVPVSAHMTQVPPHVAIVAFTGTAIVAPALYSPISNDPGCAGTLGVGVCPSGQPARGAWTFGITLGVGGHYAPPGFNTTSTVVDPLLNIETDGNPLAGGAQVVAGMFTTPVAVTGDLDWGIGGYGPWCGYSSGNDGAGTVAFIPLAGVTFQPPAAGLGVGAAVAAPLDEVGWIQSAATLIQFNGLVDGGPPGGVHGTIHGVVTALPPVPGVIGAGGCLAGNATVFTIVGGAVAIWQD